MGRNSLLEILRLLAAFWVVYYHCYDNFGIIDFPTACANGRIAVEFFFILSGLFFLRSFQKDKDKPLFKGILSFVWKRFQPIMITSIFCFVFAIIHNVLHFQNIMTDSLFHFMWYIPHLMVVFAIYFILRKLIKKDYVFNIVTTIIVVVCLALILIISPCFGMVRGLAMVGLGILISQLPKINKTKRGQLFSIITFAILFIATITIVILQPDRLLQEIICFIILFPGLCYFALQIDFSNDIVNKICSISFGVYVYQEVVMFILDCGADLSALWVFVIVTALATIDKIITTPIYKKWNKRKNIYQEKRIINND